MNRIFGCFGSGFIIEHPEIAKMISANNILILIGYFVFIPLWLSASPLKRGESS
jgi:hypothetical protein